MQLLWIYKFWLIFGGNTFSKFKGDVVARKKYSETFHIFIEIKGPKTTLLKGTSIKDNHFFRYLSHGCNANWIPFFL